MVFHRFDDFTMCKENCRSKPLLVSFENTVSHQTFMSTHIKAKL